MKELLGFVSLLISLYLYILIAMVILSWLIAFNVVNRHSDFVRSLSHALEAVTAPVLRHIRRKMPDLGGIDISPAVLALGLIFVQSVIIPNIAKTLN